MTMQSSSPLDPSGEAIASGTLTLEAGSAVSVVAAAGSDGVSFQVTPAQLAAATAQNSRPVVELMNFSVTDVTAALADGASVVDAAAGETATEALPAANENLVVSAAGAPIETFAGPLYGGANYGFVVVDGGDGPQSFALPPISVATTIGSAAWRDLDDSAAGRGRELHRSTRRPHRSARAHYGGRRGTAY